MRNYLTKTIDCKALDIDTSKMKVKFAFAQMGEADRSNDIFEFTAFNKSIQERGPKGTNEIFHLLDHIPLTTSMLSKMEEVYTEGQYLVGVSGYRNKFAWREVAWPAYEAGDITQHSIGFSLEDKVYKEDIRIITQAGIWEGSTILWGDNPRTPTLEVSKSLGITHEDQTTTRRIERITKAITNDRYDEDLKGLLIIELTQIYTELKAIETTTPAENATGPDAENKVDLSAVSLALNQFKNKLKLL
jgi:phage head maturation protease